MSQADRWKQAIAECEAELLTIHNQLADLSVRRKPGFARGDLERQLEAQRDALLSDLGDYQQGLKAYQDFQSSPVRQRQKAEGREALQKVLSMQSQVLPIAEKLDAWAADGLALLDQLNELSAERLALTTAAAKAAAPGLDEQSSNVRRNLIEWTGAHSKAWTASFQYALVSALAHIGERVENPRSVYQIAPGWQWDSSVKFSFVDAAQQQAADLAQNCERIAAQVE